MASQITDNDIQTFSAEIDKAWNFCAGIIAEGVGDKNFLKLHDVTEKAKEAADLLHTACEQRHIYETLDAEIKAQIENGNYDPFLPETMKRNAVYTVEYTTNRMARVLYELNNLML